MRQRQVEQTSGVAIVPLILYLMDNDLDIRIVGVCHVDLLLAYLLAYDHLGWSMHNDLSQLAYKPVLNIPLVSTMLNILQELLLVFFQELLTLLQVDVQ